MNRESKGQKQILRSAQNDKTLGPRSLQKRFSLRGPTLCVLSGERGPGSDPHPPVGKGRGTSACRRVPLPPVGCQNEKTLGPRFLQKRFSLLGFTLCGISAVRRVVTRDS